jgi:hypothetical protein
MGRVATFTSEQLCVAWAKQANADPKGTRQDVVADIITATGVEDTADVRKKMYNNVTQRVRQLTKDGVKFAELAGGRKGNKRDKADIAALQTLLDS